MKPTQQDIDTLAKKLIEPLVLCGGDNVAAIKAVAAALRKTKSDERAACLAVVEEIAEACRVAKANANAMNDVKVAAICDYEISICEQIACAIGARPV